ncbi:MAG: M28 family metallopeptidase [Candidatus Hodarchaeota archaeon]
MQIDILEEDSDYMFNFIKDIIDKFGPRMPCSETEARSAEFIKIEFEKTCDEVKIEPFKCHPRAFLGWIRIDVLIALGTVLLFLFAPQISPAFPVQLVLMAIIVTGNVVAFMFIWYEFFNYKEFIDPLFPEKESQNVEGRIKPSGEVKKIILFSGHHDSALQFNLLRYLKIGYGIFIFFGIGLLFLWIALSIVILVLFLFGVPLQVFFNTMQVFFVMAIPVFVVFFIFTWPGEAANQVPGAIDNLSAVAVVAGLGRYLKKHPEIIPKNMEIRLISFGCEEAGLRGAYRYAKKHFDELKKHDAELVNMECMFSPDVYNIMQFEATTRTKHSAIVTEKIKAGAELAGIKAGIFGENVIDNIAGVIGGGTDAAAFSKAKLKAATFGFGFEKKLSDLLKFINFYHQPSDNMDVVRKESLTNALKICIGYVLNESKE